MSGRAVIYGELVGAWRKTARNGNPYLTVTIRQPGAKTDRRVYVFNRLVALEIEALPLGERLALAGKLWAPPRAREPTIIADAILTARTRPKPDGKRAAQDHAARETAALPLLNVLDRQPSIRRASRRRTRSGRVRTMAAEAARFASRS
jgi:hypothetical protein